MIQGERLSAPNQKEGLVLECRPHIASPLAIGVETANNREKTIEVRKISND